MKRIIALCCISLLIASCGSKKKAITTNNTPKKEQRKRTTSVSKVERETRIIKTSPAEEKEEELPNLPYNERVSRYITQFAKVAKNEMELYGIPASITLAQGILESGAGYGNLTRRSRNHFGIKCHDWQGARVYHDDDLSQECFRKYEDASQSFRDHSTFLAGRKRYAALFKLKKSDYKGWAKGLKAAGYATDKKYPVKLISIIERYDLDQYDKEVLGIKYKKKEEKEEKVVVAPPKEEVEKQPNTEGEYIVKKGDTLYSISKRYKLSVEQLKSFNNLKDNNIKIGQTLKVSESEEFDF